MAEPIANDHVPLAFLLGARASRYAPKANAKSARTTRSTADSSSSSSNGEGGGASRGARAAADRVELFSPEVHPRAREEEARRVLQQTLLSQADSADASRRHWSEASATPTSVLRGRKELVLRQVLESRAQEQEEELGDREPRLRREGVDGDGYTDDSEPNQALKDSHGFERADRLAAFLDVAGHATRIPLLSTQEAKRIHQRAVKRQNERRASRADEMHARLVEQQQLTKQVLRAGPSLSIPAAKQVARVDLGADVDIGDADPAVDQCHDGYEDVAAHTRPVPSLAALREQHEVEQQQLRERVQEKRHMEQLARQQVLAFRQEQKRVMAGRARNVKRPSFLATLQLDKCETPSAAAPEESSPPPPALKLSGALVAPLRAAAQPQKLNQVEEGDWPLGRQQRAVFQQSEDSGGRLLFGGGFKRAARKAAERTVSPRDDVESVTVTAHALALTHSKRRTPV